MDIEIKLTLVDNDKIRVFFGKEYSKVVELKDSEKALIKIVGFDNLTAKIVEKTSKNSGEVYKCVEIVITDRVSKIVFLDNAELEIIEFLCS